jgi:hypothetical protein
LPRYAIEELEARVLLSGYDPQQPGSFMTFELPLGSAEISPIVRPLFFIQRQLNSGAGEADVTLSSGSHGPSSADGPNSAPNSPSIVLLLHHADSAAANATSLGVEGDASSSLQGGEPLPLIAISGNDSSPSDVSDFSSTSNDAGSESTSSGVTAAPAVFLVHADSGPGWVALQSTLPGPIDAPSGRLIGPELPVPFNQSFAELRGTLDAGEPTMTYDIPIGPSTQSVGVSVRPATEMPVGEVPVIDEMSLVDATGKTLEQVGPPDGAGAFPSAAVLVQLHDPPAGDRIVVDIAAVELSSSSPSSTSSTALASSVVTTPASSQSASWSVPFILDVQRQQSSASNTDAVSVAPGTETIGTLIVAPAQQPVLFASSSSPTAPAEQDGSSLLEVQPTNTAGATVAQTSDSVTESTDNFNLRVPTGPLASRGGGALGPTLALVDAEPTQPVNRLERALLQDITGGGDGELTATKSRSAGDQEFSDDPGTWPGSIGTAGTGGPVVSIPGRGGFPLKVTSLGRDPRGQFAALWATLPAVPNPDSEETSTALSNVSESALLVVPAVAYHAAPETLECPDFVKAACGLALGLGLTSGPLFPDLIASLPRRLPKWFSVLRAHSRRRVSARESTRFAVRKLPNWLYAHLASR